jgi:hypothetical protein
MQRLVAPLQFRKLHALLAISNFLEEHPEINAPARG